MAANKMVIGILGGMGSYATLDIFRRYLEKFPAEKEWERPRVIIDNNCTMPSRVVAALYGTDRELLVSQLSESVENLIKAGCSHIFLACNTSQIFLPEVFEKVPEAKDRVINIIDCLGKQIQTNTNFNGELFLLASEGTIQTHIYQNILSKYGLSVTEPEKSQYTVLRDIIEDVKQNKISGQTCEKMIKLLRNRQGGVILGCTELPIVYSVFKEQIDKIDVRIFDPLDAVLKELRSLFLA